MDAGLEKFNYGRPSPVSATHRRVYLTWSKKLFIKFRQQFGGPTFSWENFKTDIASSKWCSELMKRQCLILSSMTCNRFAKYPVNILPLNLRLKAFIWNWIMNTYIHMHSCFGKNWIIHRRSFDRKQSPRCLEATCLKSSSLKIYWQL